MTAPLSTAEVLRLRLAAQRLVHSELGTATAVVRHLGCVQSQEWAHGFWSLGLRMPEATYAGVRAEFDAGAFVRTHILRPTWHYVAPADLRWILALTSPRVQLRNAGTYRRLGLDDHVLARTAMMIVDAAAERPRTRPELAKIIAKSGIQTGDGMWLAHVVMWAELEGLICSGPLRGQQHTYVPVADRVGPAIEVTPPDPLAELALRFVQGRGPSTAADLARWSSLTATDARAGLQRNQGRLISAEIDGQSVWWAADLEPAEVDHDLAWWLPLYDELPLSHTALGFPRFDDHPHRDGEDVFVGSVIASTSALGTTDVGRWRRTVRGRSAELQTDVSPRLDRELAAAVRAAGERMVIFLGKTAVW